MTHWRWIAAVDYSDEPENSDVVVMDTGLRTIDKCDYSITAHDPSAKFTVSETFRRASPIARKRETTNTIRFSGPKALEPADNWDVVQELYFEGSHGQLGGWHSEKWEFINEHPGGRIEHAEVELHRDNDAKWELQMPAPNRIVYTLSAASCLFSCDEVRVRVYIRFVG